MTLYKRFIALLLALMLTAGYAFASAEPTVPADENTEAAEDAVPADDSAAAEETPISEDESVPVEDGTAAEETSAEPAEETASDEPETLPWQTPGNTDSEILNGGLFLYTDDGFYFSDGGIWYRSGTADRFVCAGDARNLNLSDGQLYFTIGGDVYRVCPAGGDPEIVYSFDAEIGELYVIGQELRFLAGGCVYSYSMASDTLRGLDAPADVTGLLPTEYGDLYLTGTAFHRTLWVGTTCFMTDIERCYTDDGILVILTDGQTLQADPAALFSGDLGTDSYTLHRDMAGGSGMTAEQEADAQQAYFSSDDYLSLEDDVTVNTDGMYISQNSNIAWTAQTSGTLTGSQQNIITRARLMAELKWTAAADLTWWTGTKSGTSIYAADGTVSSSSDSSEGVYLAGKTYLGAPYSQPVTNKGYIGWNISLTDFLTAAADADSLLYTTPSGDYAGYHGPYYGIDCSGFVSYAWDLSTRRTVSHLRDSDVSEYISPSLQNLQVGDTLNRDGVHVLLVTDLAYDANGSVISVEVTEQVPPKVKVTCYGEVIPGRSYEYTGKLSTLAAYLTTYDYSIYRRAVSAAVSTPDTSAVDLNAAVRDISATGWIKYNNAWYYFDRNGEMVTESWLDYNGKKYYFGYDGKMYASRWYGSRYLQDSGAMATGWCQIDSSWYYFDTDGSTVTSSWLDYNGYRYFMGSDGKMYRGSSSQSLVCTIDGSVYAFSTSGKMLTGQWTKYNGSWYYFGADGKAYTSSWLKTSAGNWYYFDSDGKMLCGSSSLPMIREIKSSTYAFDENGRMLANRWVKYNNNWYYFGSNGRRYASQWLKYNGSWYYFDSDAHMVQLSGISGTSLVTAYKIGDYIYGFNESGVMRTGWGQTIDNWYYFDSNGRAYTSKWMKTAYGNWYYFGSDGKMLADQWLEYKGYYYYFNTDGKMLANTVTPDGYTVDGSGRRV